MSAPPLPAPVSHSLKRPRFVPPGARISVAVHWARLKRRIGGSAPTESLGDPTATTDNSDNGSTFRRRGSTRDGLGEKADGESDEVGVDEVVVDQPGDFRDWGTKRTLVPGTSEHAGGTLTNPGTGLPYQSESESQRGTAFESSGGLFGPFTDFCRWRAWPVIQHFFSPVYHDKVLEEAYQKEMWYTQKSVCIFGACFLVVNWVLTVSLLPQPWSLWNKIQNYGLGPLLSIPLVFMAVLDVPRRSRWVWQFCVLASVWVSASANIIDMYNCNFYNPALKSCGNKDFLGTLYYASALPVVGLFALGQMRAVAAVVSTLWVILVGVLVLPQRIAFILINIFVFQSFVIYLHYRRDIADRRMYTMRAELKVQFRAKQKAQISERKTMDQSRRFSAYIFHEVRVPLNTALLAVQNLEGAQVFDKSSDQAVEYAALEGSLQMMSQVLNDVLDFTRMEKGGFSSVSRPFSFHNVMRSIFGPLRLDANARGLKLDTSLDLRIDEVTHRLAFPDDEKSQIVGEGDGLVLGDEMRLRQVINNLCSNAAKFTPSGGTISVRTQLVFPSSDAPSAIFNASATSTDDSDDSKYSPRLSTNRLQQHEHEAKSDGGTSAGAYPSDVVVVRIEVQDTGVGILSKDMRENRLFSAYVQTEIGRHQGGKGTGLGLSLVRQIVLLSGGRLGLKSKVGEGSCFWIEMPFLCGPQVRKTDPSEPHRRVSSSIKLFGRSGGENTDANDLRFLPALRNATTDLLHIEESSPDSIELAPTNYRFSSPPTSPSILQATIQPRFYDVGDVPPSPVPTPSTGQPSSDNQKRPENRTHMSAASAPPATTSKTKSKGLIFADGPLRVLVVDDDLLTRRLMSRMMERLGCKVDMAENGKIALEMLLATSQADMDPRSSDTIRNYDITFLDNQMPVLTGPETVSRLRALARDDLVVAITANAQLAEQESFIRNGASAVLTKPVLEDDLRKYLGLADQLRTERKNRPPGTALALFALDAQRPPLGPRRESEMSLDRVPPPL